MRILICGDRHWYDLDLMREALAFLPDKDVVIVSGHALGADLFGEDLADERGWKKDIFKAEWNEYGRSAGPIRNIEMLNTQPDLVVAFHDNIHESKGTIHCIREAQKRGIPVVLIRHSDDSIL